MERVQLLVDPGNASMLRAAGNAGFANEGVLRAHVRHRGRREDDVILSRLPSDA